MDEDKKLNENEKKENDSEEKSHKKEKTIDGEEGLETTHIKDGDGEKEHITKPANSEDEEKGHSAHKTDDRMTKRNDGAEKDDKGKAGTNKDKEGKEDQNEIVETSATKGDTGECKDKDMPEDKEEKVCNNVNGKSNGGQESREILKMASNKAHEIEVQEMMNKNIEDLKRSAVEILPPEDGNLQLKTQEQTTCVNMQDTVTNKCLSRKHSVSCHEIKMADGEIICDQSSNKKSSSLELLNEQKDKQINKVTITVGQPVAEGMGKAHVQHNIEKTVQIDSTVHMKENLRSFDNIDKEIKNEETVTEVTKEELPTGDKDMKKGGITEDGTVSTDKNLVQTINVVQGCVKVLSESKEGSQPKHDNTKKPEKLLPKDMGEGEMEMRYVSQERKSTDKTQEMSAGGETTKLLVQSETAAGKKEHEEETETVKYETDNKAKKENNAQDLSDNREGRYEYEHIGQQKQQIDDNRHPDSTYKARSLVKEAPESSAQKLVGNGGDGVQQKQICTPKETAVKSTEEFTGKSSETLISTVILPAKLSDDDKLQDIHNKTSDSKTTGRPICTVFQETVPGWSKCEENIQRSETKNSGHNQESNKIEADNSSQTDTAISNQLQQLEHKVQQSLQDKQVHLQQQTQVKQHTELHEQINKQQHTQNEEQNKKQDRKQQQQQIEKGLQEEQTKQKPQTQEMIQQTQKQGQQSGQKEQDQTRKDSKSYEEQQKYQEVKQSQEEQIHEKQPKLQQQEQQQPKQHWKSKEEQQKQARGEKQQMTEQQDEEKPKEQHKTHQPSQQQQQSVEGDSDGATGCGGAQGRSCPIYFGVKSYLHQFYDSNTAKNSQLYEDYIEEDDFEYTVDPKSRGCRKCCRGFWFRAGLWGGINLILVGIITLLVGYLTPQREMIVGHHNNLEIVDRTAVAFNRRLELCRLAGLAVFCCGGVVLLFTLLLSTFFHIGSHNNNNGYCCNENTYYGYVTTSLVEPFIATQNQGSNVPAAAGIKIPITEQIKSVQPTLWPDTATVKDGTLLPHMP